MENITQITITSKDEWFDFVDANSDAFTADDLACILIDAMTETGAIIGGGGFGEFRVLSRF